MNFKFLFIFLAVAVSIAFQAQAKSIRAVLKIEEEVPIEALADDVQNPESSHFMKFYTPEEIRQVSGPSDEKYKSIITQLKSEGFKVVNESKTRLWITVTADQTLFDKYFSTHIKVQKSGIRTSDFSPDINSHLGLESVSGIDNQRKSHPHYVKLGRAYSGGVPQATIKTAYGFDPLYKAGLSGSGQDIAIATYDGFSIANVRHFYKVSHLSPTPTIDQVKFNGTPSFDENSAMETELDSEFTGMMAPGARIHVFASAANSDAGEVEMFTAILDDNRSKVVNYSWGSCETQVSSQHMADMTKIFARAVAQGVNIFVASGDSGSDSCQNNTVAADFPSVIPNIVAVGGTSFDLAQDGTVAEKAWNGSGGGISANFALPRWQSMLGTPYLRRSYPDVSFNADPNTGQAIWSTANGKAGWYVIGGTSMAAPQWSGFMALLGEARAKAGKNPIGFINPYIYGLTPQLKDALFHDITSGKNGAYSAGPGWDAVTGWGSMNAAALLQYLGSL